jgi:hypothetical protein
MVHTPITSQQMIKHTKLSCNITIAQEATVATILITHIITAMSQIQTIMVTQTHSKTIMEVLDQ